VACEEVSVALTGAKRSYKADALFGLWGSTSVPRDSIRARTTVVPSGHSLAGDFRLRVMQAALPSVIVMYCALVTARVKTDPNDRAHTGVAAGREVCSRDRLHFLRGFWKGLQATNLDTDRYDSWEHCARETIPKATSPKLMKQNVKQRL